MTPMRMPRLLLMLASLLALSIAPAVAVAPGKAADPVQAFHAALLAAMQNAASLGPRGRFEKLDPVIKHEFDVPFMAKLAIGPTWNHLNPDQKRAATDAFGRYITATYANEFDGYSGEQFKLLGETKIRHGVLVRTQLVKSDGEAIAFNYVVHDDDNAWQIRDIYLSGTISQLATRRSEFAAILRTQGIDALIAALNKKADQLS